MTNRYARIEQYDDLGLGTDEFEGPRRFTRPTDKKTPADGQVDEGNKSIHSKGKTHV